MKKIIVYILLLVVLLPSCTEFQKISKSKNPEYKYDKAIDYYKDKQYNNAIALLEDISVFYSNSERSELIMNYLAKAHLNKKNYYTAKDYYKTYIKSFPNGRFIEEAKYMLGYCDYKVIPDVQLDQAETRMAISEFQQFVAEFPQSNKAKKAGKILDKLYDRLAEKELLNATLYYDLGIYLGNNYKSAVIVAENALKRYPSNKYREDFLILILKAKYKQAVYSIESRKEERYRETRDEYYSYINEFPEGKFVKGAKKIFEKSKNK